MPTCLGPTLSKTAEPIQAWLTKRQELELLFLLVINKLLLFPSLILAQLTLLQKQRVGVLG